MMLLLAGILGLIATQAFATDYPEAGPTYEASKYTAWNLKKTGKSKRGEIRVDFKDSNGNDDYVAMTRLDLVGNAYDRGYGHGYLLAKEIVEFVGPKLDKYFMDEVLNLDISQFPDPLRKILEVIKIKGAVAAPAAFKAAMSWVWDKEKSFVPDYFIQEINGMATGLCDSMKSLNQECDVAEWETKIQQFNMLPELIRMACTAYGAWGKATDTGGLIQIRALDFGGGPFANYTILQVNRETENDNAFVSVAFPAFVGVVTGVSQHGVGVSEKVWMTYDKRSLQPGSYDGLADVFVLRNILQYSKNRADAMEYLQNVNRTWAIWIGLGDYETQQLDLVGYKQVNAIAYTDVTAPSMTGQPYIDSIAYVDKHPQPSGEGPTGTLPTALTDFYGQVNCETSKVITKYHSTGDLHIASYDYKNKLLYVSIGRVNHAGEYGNNGEWKAYNRPYLKFNLEDLWQGK